MSLSRQLTASEDWVGNPLAAVSLGLRLAGYTDGRSGAISEVGGPRRAEIADIPINGRANKLRPTRPVRRSARDIAPLDELSERSERSYMPAKSWRSSNEGRACDAVLHHIEARDGSARGQIRWPEREGHAAPIELAVEVGGRTLAVEHTTVEAYSGQIQDNVNFELQMALISAALTLLMPADWDIIIPVEALRNVPPRRFASMHDAIVRSIVGAAVSSTVEPWGVTQHWPTHLGPETGCPISLRFRRFRLGEFSPRFMAGAHITRSVGPLEEPRIERMRKVCEDKLPTLAAWRALGAHTILILESDDFILTSEGAVAEAYLSVEGEREDRPDEVYFVFALDDPNPSSRWYLSVVRAGDKSGKALWENGTNIFEIDPRTLCDLTARSRA